MSNNKNLGLDIIRVFSAFLVILCHSGYFSIGIHPSLVTYSGILAVDFFFVLSGLLVGRRLILAVTDPQPAQPLKIFYVSRFFRTVPLYYLMLLVTGFLKGTLPPLRCFLFLHNFSDSDIWFMPVAWSLSIEMWFYFVIPPVFLLLFNAFRRKATEQTSVFLATGVLYLIPLILRIVCVMLFDPEWDTGVRKQILLRLDAILLGVFFAGVKLYAKNIYKKIAGSKLTLAVSVIGILVSFFLHRNYYSLDGNYDNSSLSKIFAFTLLPMLCILLVVYLENCEALNGLRRYRFFRLFFWLSSLTYGIYLIQLPVFEFISPYFSDASFSMSWLGFMSTVAITVLLAQIAYWTIETPCEKIKIRILSAK